jgi:hypothetical protein
MSIFERLLAPDSTEGPECRCGEEMKIVGVDALLNSIDAQIRIYKCPSCQHEMRLTVWMDDYRLDWPQPFPQRLSLA